MLQTRAVAATTNNQVIDCAANQMHTRTKAKDLAPTIHHWHLLSLLRSSSFHACLQVAAAADQGLVQMTSFYLDSSVSASGDMAGAGSAAHMHASEGSSSASSGLLPIPPVQPHQYQQAPAANAFTRLGIVKNPKVRHVQLLFLLSWLGLLALQPQHGLWFYSPVQ
jgi:hypothetical protein